MEDIIVIQDLAKEQLYTIGDNEHKTFVIFLSGGKDQVGELKIVIDGKKAYVQILGIIIGNKRQTIKLATLQDHRRPESVSDLLIKSVLFDRARFNYEGLIEIRKNAQKSNAYQKNQNLLMSKNASADSKPYLQILANDVRCTHGATVGTVDRDQLYYLATRGLTERSSTQLLIQGFLSDVIGRIPDDTIRQDVERQTEMKLATWLAI